MAAESKDNDKAQNKPMKPDDDQETSPLPPPHPVTPPPQNPHNQDSSELLSPWWSAEPPPDRPPEKKDSQVLLNISRSADVDNVVNGEKTGEKTTLWKEKCFVLTTRKPNSKLKGDAIKDHFQSECRMVCFLRESEKLREARKEKLNLTNSWNPFYGTWLVVATTRARCLEHMGETIITKKNRQAGRIKLDTLLIRIVPDYYTIELGERLGRSGEDAQILMSFELAKELARKTFAPVQELSNRFWESAKRGDAFHLVVNSTKRFLDNAVGHDKKSDNNDKKK
ncbi:hypothetical protein EC973_007549 [Apophysomyces ossiformis]|uniref:Uncharacterized protein n=1 Tax=Apophysomyces ossiformis TaxID=679940 RepID=A0A8H7BP09_9FUNG|nr:hypothetical protein EC973_007549 [Apophysomyces ossiformis]